MDILILQEIINFIFNNNKLYYIKNENKYIEIYNLFTNTCKDNCFLEELKKIEKNFGNILLKIQKSKIENIFILLVIYPFLKKNSVVFYKIRNIEDYNKLKNILNIKRCKKTLKINKKDINYLIEHFNNYIYYDWEVYPSLDLLKKIRYIINNYYKESTLKIFDKSLNLNMRNYIKNNKNDLNSEKIYNLMSKLKLI